MWVVVRRNATAVQPWGRGIQEGGWVESNHTFLFCLNCHGDQNKPLRLPLVVSPCVLLHCFGACRVADTPQVCLSRPAVM